MIRIVQMTFRPDAVDAFLALFEERKVRIASVPGCKGVDLLRDRDRPNVLFTYSHWDGPEHLEAYRQSELFQDTWKLTKALFSAPAHAWSVDVASSALPK
jgi:quinol monooxygenase YgiN